MFLCQLCVQTCTVAVVIAVAVTLLSMLLLLSLLFWGRRDQQRRSMVRRVFGKYCHYTAIIITATVATDVDLLLLSLLMILSVVAVIIIVYWRCCGGFAVVATAVTRTAAARDDRCWGCLCCCFSCCWCHYLFFLWSGGNGKLFERGLIFESGTWSGGGAVCASLPRARCAPPTTNSLTRLLTLSTFMSCTLLLRGGGEEGAQAQYSGYMCGSSPGLKTAWGVQRQPRGGTICVFVCIF